MRVYKESEGTLPYDDPSTSGVGSVAAPPGGVRAGHFLSAFQAANQKTANRRLPPLPRPTDASHYTVDLLQC